jgi:hypothetical protein
MLALLDIRKILDELMPMVIRKFSIGIGSFLTFDMESQSSGEMAFVWVYLCDWRLKVGPNFVATSDDNLNEEKYLFDIFSPGLCLLNICRPKPGRLDLLFDKNIKLMLKDNAQVYSPDDDLLKVYIRDSVIVYASNNGFRILSKYAQS